MARNPTPLSLDNLGPNREAHNARIRLLSGTLAAIGFAALIIGMLAPQIEYEPQNLQLASVIGVIIWFAFLGGALALLSGLKTKGEP